MKVSSRNIKTIQERLDKLYNEFHIKPLDSFNKVKIGDEDVFIDYPEDHIEEPLPVEDFLDYTNDLDGIEKVDESTVRMGDIRQTIIDIDNYRYDYLVPEITFENEIITMAIVECPVLIGLMASKEGIYNEDFGVSPCSMYTAIELRYKTDKRYSKKEEDELIARFLYHIAAEYDVSIEVGEFAWWEDITGEEKPDAYQLDESSLIPFSEAMYYYSSALQINDPDIQFHHLYKIIEHFSPVVSRKMAYERLNQKLDTMSVVGRDYQYLDSLLELASHYELSLKDKMLCRTVLLECIDIVSLFDLLPVKIQEEIAKKCTIKIAELDNCSDSDIAKVKTEVGEVIYETRNRIVHAKSNWSSSEKACNGDDMEEMNEFMKAMAKCLILWNGRQPKEFRL